MTTIATAEDLGLASVREIREAYDGITRFRNRPTTGQLLRNRIDVIQAELMEVLEGRELRRCEIQEEFPDPGTR
jgi:hypothetical protein